MIDAETVVMGRLVLSFMKDVWPMVIFNEGCFSYQVCARRENACYSMYAYRYAACGLD